MGQYFFVVNLDKRKTFGCFGKFGEFFFHGLGDKLAYHLQRRLTPPLDPLPNGGKQLQGFPVPVLIDPERERFKARMHEKLRALVKNWPTDECERRDRSIPRSDSGLATINELPDELLSMIFSFMLIDETAYDTALGLAITNSRFWNTGKKVIANFITSRETTAEYWVGDRIICIGDNVEDLPPHLDVKQFGLGIGDTDRLNLYALYGLPESSTLPESPKWWKRTTTCDPVGKAPGFKPWQKPFERDVIYARNGACRPDPDVSASSATEWILRNLTKKEYTREDDGQGGSFDHRLIIRSCWSTNIGSICLDPEPERLYHGPWAGDRFDIVPSGDLELVKGEDGKVVKVEGWKDVTDELRKELDEIYNAEYGYVRQ